MNESHIKPRQNERLYTRASQYYNGQGYDYIEVGTNKEDLILLPPEFKQFIERDLREYYPAIRRAIVWSNRWHALRSWLRAIPTRIRSWFSKKPSQQLDSLAALGCAVHFWGLTSDIRNSFNRVSKCYKQFDLYGNPELMYTADKLAEHSRY